MGEARTILVSTAPPSPFPDFEIIIEAPSDAMRAVEYVEWLLDSILKPELRPMVGWGFIDGIN